MKNRKGFTLIELLAVIVILGVIMIIAIPSVTNYITNARKDSFVSDAKMFLDAAKTRLIADATLPQGSGEQVLISINEIALDKGGEKSPFGNDWDLGKSYVYAENIGTSSDPEYIWKVALVDVKGNCIPLTNDKDLKREVVGTGCSIPSTLISRIIAGNPTIDATLDFNAVPTAETSGVFIRNGSENNTNPVYYYRGIVANNNVKFANFCWKIIRTTETGGIKLIYNGVPANDESCNNTGTASQLANKSTFNAGYNDNAYMGYMYGNVGANTYEETHANTNDSTIKTAIDSWYQTNMTAYTNKLEDTVWCNDRSFATENLGNGAGSSITYYGAYSRVGSGAVDTKQPNLSCINNNDKFTVSTSNGNGELTYQVGLLTADEVTLAGIISGNSNSSNYLYTGEVWWLNSPNGFDGNDVESVATHVYAVNYDGKLSGYNIKYSNGIRPTISLKSGTVVTSGDGSVSTPYVIE